MFRFVAAAGVSIAALLFSGCLEEQTLTTASESAPIIGGISDLDSPAVAFTQHGGGNCTGTLIGRRLVLTAAHCIEPDISENRHNGTVRFGPGGADGFEHSVSILRLAAHRKYNPLSVTNFDIGLIRLREEAPEEIPTMDLHLDPIPNLMGEQVRTVGFGVTDGQAQTGAGTKKQVFLTVSSMSQTHIGIGDENKNICQGDSGGPTFLTVDGVEIVVGVSSFGSNFCQNESKVTRTDVYADDFLRQIIGAWGDGPCTHDGVCVEEGCGEFADPDCDGCGFDGFCQSGCPELDIDCPVGFSSGELCNNNDECESRLCVEALDDPRVKYCSESCGDTTCGGVLPVCQDNGEGPACYFDGITPSTQGAPCSSGSECRSGACDTEFNICVEQCGSGFPECGDGFECVSVGGAKACSIPRDSGGCEVGGSSGSRSRGAIAVLGLLALVAIRRRTRSPRR